LFDTLGSTRLVDSHLIDFVDQKDWAALEHMYEPLMELHPLLVTCQRPTLTGSETFDVKITPFAASAVVVQVCFQVQGEVREYTTDMRDERRDEEVESESAPSGMPEIRVDVEHQARPDHLAVVSGHRGPWSLSSIQEDEVSVPLSSIREDEVSLGARIDDILEYLRALSNCATVRNDDVNRTQIDQMSSSFQGTVTGLLSEMERQLKWRLDGLIATESQAHV